jgi:hypothetical protein
MRFSRFAQGLILFGLVSIFRAWFFHRENRADVNDVPISFRDFVPSPSASEGPAENPRWRSGSDRALLM